MLVKLKVSLIYITYSFENYRKFITEDNEFRYVVNEVIKAYVYDLLEYYEIIKREVTPERLHDLETYKNATLRNEAISAYYKLLNKYVEIRKYYEKISKLDLTEEEISTELLNVNKRKVIFTHPSNNPTKSRLILDMKVIPNEYYDSVLDLLNRFINGKISNKEFKSLTNNKKASGYTELRHDQIRIVTKHIKDNIYDVVGVFVKKSDNDIQQYRTMFNRLITDIDTENLELKELELSKLIMKELEDLVNEKARKSSR